MPRGQRHGEVAVCNCQVPPYGAGDASVDARKQRRHRVRAPQARAGLLLRRHFHARGCLDLDHLCALAHRAVRDHHLRRKVRRLDHCAARVGGVSGAVRARAQVGQRAPALGENVMCARALPASASSAARKESADTITGYIAAGAAGVVSRLIPRPTSTATEAGARWGTGRLVPSGHRARRLSACVRLRGRQRAPTRARSGAMPRPRRRAAPGGEAA